MKKRIRFGFVALVFFISFSQQSFAQGNFSVLFDGVVLGGSPRFFEIGKSTLVVDLNQMKAKNTVFPGMEVRFNQKGRVTLGASYQKWQLERGPEHFSTKIGGGPNAGETAKTWDESQKANANVVVATLYVNLVKRGKVRPFVGAGIGYAGFSATRSEYNIWWNPHAWYPLPPEATQPQTYTATFPRVVAKGVAGLNIYPVKQVVFSLAGGYLNGTVFNSGVGLTF